MWVCFLFRSTLAISGVFGFIIPRCLSDTILENNIDIHFYNL